MVAGVCTSDSVGEILPESLRCVNDTLGCESHLTDDVVGDTSTL